MVIILEVSAAVAILLGEAIDVFAELLAARTVQQGAGHSLFPTYSGASSWRWEAHS